MRIVVVEDNELYRDELLQCLEQEESDIEIIGSAANGARGLALVEKLVREKAGPGKQFVRGTVVVIGHRLIEVRDQISQRTAGAMAERYSAIVAAPGLIMDLPGIQPDLDLPKVTSAFRDWPVQIMDSLHLDHGLQAS